MWKSKFGWVSMGILFGLIWVMDPWSVQAAGQSAKLDPKLQEELQAIQQELQEIKKALHDIQENLAERPPTPPAPPSGGAAAPARDTIVSLDDDPVLGKPDAPLVLIEFSDYQCPFCGRFFLNTFPEIDKEYIQTGKIRYVFRDFPLAFHQQAPKASEAANCSGEQGKYWEMHDKLFGNQTALQVDRLRDYARDLGLDVAAFNSCLDSGKFAAEIQKDVLDGERAGITGTPSFFVGVSEDGKTIKGKIIVGAKGFSYFKQQIDSLLNPKAPLQIPGR